MPSSEYAVMARVPARRWRVANVMIESRASDGEMIAKIVRLSTMDAAAVIEATRRWIDSIVIGLNLCPFAQRSFAAIWFATS